MARILWLLCAVSMGCGSRAGTPDESASAPAAPAAAPAAPAAAPVAAEPAAVEREEEAWPLAELLTDEVPPGTISLSDRQPGAALTKSFDEIRNASAEVGATIEVHMLDDSSLTAGDITIEIRRRYIAGIERCYQARLKREPTAARSVSVPFTIGANGRVTPANPSSTPTDGDLAACLASTVRSWRFPIPRDEDGEATAVDVIVELKLTP